MKKVGSFLGALVLLLVIVSTAGATLTTIGTATYNNGEYNLIWDDDNNGNSLIWLDYSNNKEIWGSQMTWAAGLDLNTDWVFNILDEYTVAWDDDAWRLPTTVDGSAGYNKTTSEMGHLFYEELGNLEHSLKHTGDFDNLSASYYWSGTEYASDTRGAWYFSMQDGLQSYYDKSFQMNGIAVRSGQVSASAVPEPATMFLFGIGLLGFARLGRKQS